MATLRMENWRGDVETIVWCILNEEIILIKGRVKSVVVKYVLGNAEKIIQSVGRFLLVYVRLSVMEGGGWRNKQHHLLSTKRIRPKLKVLYAVHAYIFRNSFRIHLLFLFFIHIKISVFIILPSRKDLCHFRRWHLYFPKIYALVY